MKSTPMKLFNDCYGKYGIAAINVFTMEQVLGVFKAASIGKSPVILQTTPVARDYSNPLLMKGMISAAEKVFPDVVFAVHLDHGNETHINAALKEEMYNSVMIDASHEDFDQNVSRTKKIVESAHSQDVFVEAELGILSGVEDNLVVEQHHAKYTDPEAAEKFVCETNCDSLAIAVGTSHGAYKFSGDQGINFSILEQIQKRLPGFPLVLHGGSSVSQVEIQRINNAGGNLKENARGVSSDELKKSISLGVCKVNIATDLRVLWTRVHREFFVENPEQFDPILPGKLYQDELIKFCLQKFELLGSLGKARSINSYQSKEN
ncbi:ketose-bisphosphate aldolase [Echinicola sp. 20G]|uniref:class II fructose-bisphosphate aldolase n=1 Tax=Echinicola sp. 20G TaxID=2781961 RepID=UPI00191042AA|nr:ketose-bisphosphate aldolase [Echinicola sp. 20G]